MTLYEMTEQARQLYELLLADEIDEQTLTDTLEAIGAGEKLENYCKVIRQLEADAAAYKAEKDRLAAKQRQAENAIERMKTAVANYMQAIGKTKTDAGVFKVSITQTKSTNIIDESLIPNDYIIPQPPKIDKSSIRKALLAGAEIPGVTLQINSGVRIR